ncbi:E2 domain-containing protein [Luteimonas sp. SDU101]|uniref:E2 domain-containing protein n=1 Tax=Luteimonas sp. SDU101 TaxID=3422593 RepID=UPI003EBF56CC
MSVLSSPLACLDKVASEFAATLSSATSPAKAVISVPRAGGDRHDFVLELSVTGSAVSVREEPPVRLPVFCPDRHINAGGSFCLGWGSTAAPAVVDEDSARTWWTRVTRFLQLQLTANELGIWPNRANDWAHGDAAGHQALAEAAADSMGERFRRDLRAGNFSVIREPHVRGARLELRREGRHIARIAIGPPAKLKGSQVSCPCDQPEGMTVDGCRDHVDQLIRFVLELWRWRQSEGRFLRELAKSGAACCGTLKSCKLRDAITRDKASTTKRNRHARRHKPRRRPRL